MYRNKTTTHNPNKYGWLLVFIIVLTVSSISCCAENRVQTNNPNPYIDHHKVQIAKCYNGPNDKLANLHYHHENEDGNQQLAPTNLAEQNDLRLWAREFVTVTETVTTTATTTILDGIEEYTGLLVNIEFYFSQLIGASKIFSSTISYVIAIIWGYTLGPPVKFIGYILNTLLVTPLLFLLGLLVVKPLVLIYSAMHWGFPVLVYFGGLSVAAGTVGYLTAKVSVAATYYYQQQQQQQPQQQQQQQSGIGYYPRYGSEYLIDAGTSKSVINDRRSVQRSSKEYSRIPENRYYYTPERSTSISSQQPRSASTMRIYRHRSLGDMRMSASKLGVIDEILSDNDDQDQDQLVPSNSSGGNRSKEEESGGGNDDKFDTLSQALNGEAGVTRWQSKLAKNQDYKRREVEVKDT